MKIVVLALLALSLTGCMVTDRAPDFYTRSEIDAIYSEAQCKQLARNLVQIYRCRPTR